MSATKRPGYREIIGIIKASGHLEAVAKMARFGITPDRNYGVCMPVLVDISRRVGKDHALAERLWSTGIREAMIVACLIDDPKLVTEEQMNRWVKDFRSWDICDGCCLHLFADAQPALTKAIQWTRSRDEYTKRAGYVIIAVMALRDRRSGDGLFRSFFPLIVEGSTDERNYVKKAVNWALRQIGKRNLRLNKEAISVARRIQKLDSKPARWIASDALRELGSEKTQERLRTKRSKG